MINFSHCDCCGCVVPNNKLYLTATWTMDQVIERLVEKGDFKPKIYFYCDTCTELNSKIGFAAQTEKLITKAMWERRN